MTTISVNKPNEVQVAQKEASLLEGRRLAAILAKDSISEATLDSSLVLAPQGAPKLAPPKKTSQSADDAMAQFCKACEAAFDASASASATQTANTTNLNKLNNSLEYTVLLSTQTQIAQEQAEQQIEDNLASAIDDAQKREGGVGSALGWVGFAFVTVLVLVSLVCTYGADAEAAAPAEGAAADSLIGDGADDAADEASEAGGNAAGSSVSDLESEQSQVEDEMASNQSNNENVQDSAKSNADEQVKPKSEDSSFKSKVKNGCKWIRDKLKPESKIFKAVKFSMQVTGGVCSSAPPIIKGVDQIDISYAQDQLADCQRSLGQLKGELQGNVTVATSFETINKKMGDVANDLVTQVGADISLSGSAFTTWGRVEIEG